MEEPKIEATPGEGYAGDVRPSQAWEVLSTRPDAQLVDVRTTAEWAYVGVPDLSGVGKEVIRIQWQAFPDMAVDPQFAARLEEVFAARGAGIDSPVFFICRSGARSAAAARVATELGHRHAYNVAHGFEGDRDQHQHRGRMNGWKVEGLPWVQR